MKLVMDERVKHRLTGLIVILSIVAIFLPAVVKKSNQRFEESLSFSVRLPPKPVLPNVAVSDEKKVFETVKVARVDVPAVVEISKPIQIARAEPISRASSLPSAPVSKTAPIVAENKASTLVKLNKKTVMAKSSKKITNDKARAVASTPAKVAIVSKKLATAAVIGVKKDMYAVQLASFSQRNNALSLVARLRNKGYKASYSTSNGKQGLYYKVTVGQLNQRNDAVHLQKQLADSMQLNGFIVKTGVS